MNKQLLLDELSRFPEEWRYVCCSGKYPIGKSWQNPGLTKIEALEKIVNDGPFEGDKGPYSKPVTGIGIITGAASEGIICLDIDGPEGFQALQDIGNINALPVTFGNRGRPEGGKSFFRVPEEYWDKIGTLNRLTKTDAGHSDGYELLWGGRQALLFGKHPDVGSYEYVSGIDESGLIIADAPDWLIDLAKEGKNDYKPQSRRKFTPPTQKERLWDALDSLPPDFYDDYDKWLKVGMAIHDDDPSNLDMYHSFSQKSTKYVAKECDRKWRSFSSGGGRSVNSIFFWAKDNGWTDPNSKQTIAERQQSGMDGDPFESCEPQSTGEEQAQSTEKTAHEILLDEIKAVMESSNAPWQRRMQLHDLATTYKVTEKFIKEVYASYSMSQAVKDFVTLETRQKEQRKSTEFLIPGLLPCGALTLLIADPGCGKTVLCYSIAHAVASGEPLGERVVANPGNVLIIQLDEGQDNCEEKLSQMEACPQGIITNYNVTLEDLPLIEAAVEEHNIKLIIFDSLYRGNVHCGYDLNEAGYANNVAALQAMCAKTGVACILCHHTNKGAGTSFGTQYITANVDEQWKLYKESNKDKDIIGDESDAPRKLKHLKTRNSCNGEYDVEYDADTLKVTLPPSGGNPSVPVTSEDIVFLYLNKRQNIPFTVRELAADNSIGYSSKIISERLKELTERGAIVREKHKQGRKWWFTYKAIGHPSSNRHYHDESGGRGTTNGVNPSNPSERQHSTPPREDEESNDWKDLRNSHDIPTPEHNQVINKYFKDDYVFINTEKYPNNVYWENKSIQWSKTGFKYHPQETYKVVEYFEGVWENDRTFCYTIQDIHGITTEVVEQGLSEEPPADTGPPVPEYRFNVGDRVYIVATPGGEDHYAKENLRDWQKRGFSPRDELVISERAMQSIDGKVWPYYQVQDQSNETIWTGEFNLTADKPELSEQK